MNADEIALALRESCTENEFAPPMVTNRELIEASDLIGSLQAQLADYHHMSKLVDGKMGENQRLRRINENLQAQLEASQRREKAAVGFIKYLDRNYSGYMAEDERFAEWRGPQAGEGGRDG